MLQIIDRLDVGGAERVLVDLSNLLVNKGVEVTVLSILGPGELETELDERIAHKYLYRRYRFQINSVRSMQKLIRNFDIVHIHSRHNLKYFFFSVFFNRYIPKIVFHDHSRKTNLGFYLKYCLSKIDAYIGVTQSQCKLITERIKISPDKIYLLENIVVPSSSMSNSIEFSDRVQMVMIGNFRPVKNYEFALRLLHCLNKKKDYTLDIYGRIVDQTYYNKLISLVEELRLGNKVKIVTDAKDIQKYLFNYHIGLHTSYSETGPLSLIEFLACNLRFVAHKTGEVSKQLENYLPDFFMTDFDLDRWQRSVELLLMKDEYREMIPDLFQKLYASDKYVDRCLQIYRKIGCS